MSLQDRLDDIVQGKKKVPVAETVGFTMISCKDGKAKFAMTASQKHHNPMGTLHGGILCDIADAAMGMAFASTLQPGETFATISLQINFLVPIIEAKLFADAEVIKRGRSIGFVEAKVTDDAGTLIATVQSSCKIINSQT